MFEAGMALTTISLRTMPLLGTIILFYGIMIHRCDSSCIDEADPLKTILFINAKNLNQTLCFNPNATDQNRGNQEKVEVSYENGDYTLTLETDTLAKYDIVLREEPLQSNHAGADHFAWEYNCTDNSSTIVKLTQTTLPELCGNPLSEAFKVTIKKGNHCLLKPNASINISVPKINETTGAEQAVKLLDNLPEVLEMMGRSTTAALTAGQAKGILTRISSKSQNTMSFGLNSLGDVGASQGKDSPEYLQSVKIPTESIAMAVEANSSFVAVMFFPGAQLDDSPGIFLNNRVVAIEMGTRIANLSEPISIQFDGVQKNGRNFSCRSWDGAEGAPVWIPDGCETEETNNSVTCLCSHLTFFAILITPPNEELSAADLKALSTITSVGCGLSLFFQVVALTMHCLIRKQKSNLETKILIQLFVAMLTMNLSFLVNETIAGLGNVGACVSAAAFLHYSLLATFTWFFMQALHLFFKFKRINSEIKHYMKKIYVTGWVTPGIVVSVLLILKKYELLYISTTEGTQVNMCWIPDAMVHQGVNVGYYSVVFLFTLIIFIIIARQISLLSSAVQRDLNTWSIKKKVFSVLTLFILLGLTWSFAFFCHGPLTLTCYYIFTILNSFQGLFLFIYYYKSSRIFQKDARNSSTSSNPSMEQTDVTAMKKVHPQK